MACHCSRVLAFSVFIVLAGCAGVVPGVPTSTPTAVEPGIVSTTSTGAQCVDQARVGLTVDGARAAGVWTVTVEGNVTVDGSHYGIEGFDFRQVDGSTYRLDVNTTADTGKPVRECDQGGIVHYRATVEFPTEPAFELQIRHDGVLVSAVGSGAES